MDSKTAQILHQLEHRRLTGAEFEAPELQASIRLRPAMYVGDRDSRGLHETLTNLIDVSVEEHVRGGATEIEVSLQNGSVAIADNGRGVSGEPIADLDGRSLLEVAVTTCLMNGRLRPDSADRLNVSIPAAAALAETFRVESCHEGRRYEYSMHCGRPAGPLRDLGPTERQGTRFEWRPDPTIFRETTLDAALIRDRLQFLSARHPGLVIQYRDDLLGGERFCSLAGMADRVRHLIGTRRGASSEVFAVQARQPGLTLDVAFCHGHEDETRIETYANGERTCGDGTHWQGFQRGVIGLLRAKARDRARQSDPPVPLDWPSFERGLVAVLSIDAANLLFESPTRDRIENHEISDRVAEAVRGQLEVWLSEHPALLETLLRRADRTA